MEHDEDEDLIAEDENFKTAIHHTVGKLCQRAVVEKKDRDSAKTGEKMQSGPIEFSKAFMASLTEIVLEMSEHWAKDLEAFAKHAKRTTVNADDVRLLARRSPSLIKHLEQAADLKAKSTDQQPKVKRARKKKEPANVAIGKDEALQGAASAMQEDEEENNGDDDLNAALLFIDDEGSPPNTSAASSDFQKSARRYDDSWNEGNRASTSNVSNVKGNQSYFDDDEIDLTAFDDD